jgi:D-glycero-alpha-D-manno-heptose-7-phosphate kinase
VNKLESSILLYFTGASRISSKIINNQINNLKSNNTNSIEAMKVIKQQAYNIKESIIADDFSAFINYFNLNWTSKKQTDDSISNSEINDLIEGSFLNGAFGAKVSGAGGGGFIVFLVDIFNRKKLKDFLNSNKGFIYEASFDFDGARIINF